MITTGIIREVNLSSDNYTANIYKVELPLFKSAADSSNYYVIIESNVCLPGGIYDCYSVDDFVYVGFINNKYNCPVILGKIYKGLSNDFCGSIQPQNLNVLNSVILPVKTSIGDITYNDLLESVTFSKDLNALNNYNSEKIIISKSEDELVYSNTPSNIGTWMDGSNLNKITFCWEKSTAENVNFSKDITLPETYKDFWCDTSFSYIDSVGQPFYKTANNNFCVDIDKTNHKITLSGKVTKSFNKIFVTILFTN